MPVDPTQYLLVRLTDGTNFYTAGGGGGGGGSSVNFSAGTTSNNLASVVFSNSNGVTFGLNGSTITGSVQTNYLTTAMASNAGSNFVQANAGFAGTSASGTIASNGIAISIGPYLTTAMQSNAVTLSNVKLSAGASSANLSAVTFSNSNGVSFGLNGSTLTGSVAAQTVQTQGFVNLVSLVGNTAGQTSAGSGSLVLAGGPNVTLSGSTAAGGMTVSLSAPAGGGGGAVTFSAGTASAALGSVVFSNANGVSFGLNGSTITASAAGGGGAAPNRRYIEVMQGERLTTIRNLSETVFSRRPIFMPFWLDGTGLEVSTVRLMVSGAASSNRSLQASFGVALYSAADATQLSLFGTASLGYNITASSQSSVWNGPRLMDFTGMTGTMSTEGRWVLALSVSATTHNATFCNVPIYGADNMPSLSGYLVGGTSAATNATNQVLPFWGVYSATSAGFPATVGLTQINGGNSASLLDAYAIIKEL